MTEHTDPHNDPLICPIRGEFTACDVSELQPLVDFLSANERVAEQTAFPRGTMLPDGRLDLCKQSIGPGGAAMVATGVPLSSHTRHLLLGANGLGSAGAKAVAGIVRESESLETVYLGCNMIRADAVEELVEAIQANSQVNALWLKRNPIGPQGAAAVAGLLRSGHHLECLDLVHTEMQEEGLADVLQALTDDNRTVRRLYLCGNQIRPDQCHQISRLLTTNDALKHLYLSVNQIGDAGTKTIAAGLAQNTSLQTLSLASNRIGCEGAAALADALSTSALQTLELGCESSTFVLGEEPNHIGDRGAKAIAQALLRNSTLRILNLSRNAVTEVGIRDLLRSLDENTTLCDVRHSVSLCQDLRDWLNDGLLRNRSRTSPLRTDPHLEAIQSVYRAADIAVR